MAHRLTVFFRFDDYSASSPVEIETALVAALRRHKVAATFGVIPEVTKGRYNDPNTLGTVPYTPAKIDFLRRAAQDGSVDIALHGFNHRTRSSAGPHSEFVGMPADEQRVRLRQGRDVLRHHFGVEPTVFIPPWNRYDQQTLEALSGLGIRCLSANRYGPSHESLFFVPITAELRELREAVAQARKNGDADSLIGILLHPYDFMESGDPRASTTFEEFDEELAWLATQPDVRVASIAALCQENTSLNADRYRANQPLPFEAILPPMVGSTRTTMYYSPESGARRKKLVRALGAIGFYVGVAALGFGLERLARDGFGDLIGIEHPFPAMVAGAVMLALLVRAAMRRQLNFRAMSALALTAGAIGSPILP
jgi:predicted deacetylase